MIINQKEYAKQDRAELSCTNAGLRDKIGQHFHHAASPPFVSSAPVADAMMLLTHLEHFRDALQREQRHADKESRALPAMPAAPIPSSRAHRIHKSG